MEPPSRVVEPPSRGVGPQPSVIALLPMIQDPCALDDAALNAQLDRYRTIGAGAEVLEHDRRRVVIRVSPAATGLAGEAVDVERRCCPFFGIDWRPEQRRLAVSVDRAENEVALAAIAQALGLADPQRR